MFTGLIEQQGEVLANIPQIHGPEPMCDQSDFRSNRLVIKSPFKQLAPGESIAVNGVCLTLLPEHAESEQLSFDLSPETLDLTTLGQLNVGDKVNLERAILATTRFSGHYVSGHVDTTAYLKSMTFAGECREITIGHFAISASMYLFPKGSITLDGVSLTINEVSADLIKLMLVPHTLAQTTLGQVKIGQGFNVEFDYLAKIVAHQLKVAGQLRNEVESI
jgi:riboflavin synthase